MSSNHTGNVQPAIDLEEHDATGGINTKRVVIYGYIPGTDTKVKLTAIDNGDGTYSLKTAPSGTVTVAPVKASAANSTTKVSVGSSSTTVLASNASRKSLMLVNDSDEIIYVNFSGTAVMNEGIRLNANGGSVTDDIYTGAVKAICASGSKNLTVTEL